MKAKYNQIQGNRDIKTLRYIKYNLWYFRLGHGIKRVHNFTSDSVNLYYFLLYIIIHLNNFKESGAGKTCDSAPDIQGPEE
jgi:hypothetical protein